MSSMSLASKSNVQSAKMVNTCCAKSRRRTRITLDGTVPLEVAKDMSLIDIRRGELRAIDQATERRSLALAQLDDEYERLQAATKAKHEELANLQDRCQWLDTQQAHQETQLRLKQQLDASLVGLIQSKWVIVSDLSTQAASMREEMEQLSHRQHQLDKNANSLAEARKFMLRMKAELVSLVTQQKHAAEKPAECSTADSQLKSCAAANDQAATSSEFAKLSLEKSFTSDVADSDICEFDDGLEDSEEWFEDPLSGHRLRYISRDSQPADDVDCVVVVKSKAVGKQQQQQQQQHSSNSLKSLWSKTRDFCRGCESKRSVA